MKIKIFKSSSNNINKNCLKFNMNYDQIPYNKIKKISFESSKKINLTVLQEIQKELAENMESTPGIAKALIFGLLHTGGTVNKSAPNHSFSFEFEGKRFYLELSTLRSICNKIMLEKNIKFTLRQLARTHQDEILEFAIKLDIKGNLQKKLSQMNPTLNSQQLIFAADYIDPYNLIIPESIKQLLIQHKIKINIKK